MSKYIKPCARCCFAQLNPLLSLLECRLTIWIQLNRVNWHACLKNPRVTMRHKISYSYKTMFANCRIPNGHWKTLMLIAANRTPCRRHPRTRLQSHPHGLLLPKESAHPCRSSSQCNRTCSYKPTAAAHASEHTTLPYRGPQHS